MTILSCQQEGGRDRAVPGSAVVLELLALGRGIPLIASIPLGTLWSCA